MKGLKIERAKPSNAIDIYALLCEAQKEGVLPDKPSERQLKAYYFGGLLREIVSPQHIFFVAKRGRGYLGYAHAFLVPGRWDGVVSRVIVNQVFVVKHRRKNGIGRKLLDELKKQIENIGIKRVEFACPAIQMEYWARERGALATDVIMGVDL